MIGKITRENAVNDVKDGMTYLRAAELHGVNQNAVEQWCRAAGVRSLCASRRKTDDEILDAVTLHKVATCHMLAETLGCSDSAANRHLQTMVMNGKIQSFRIPPLSSSASVRRGLFTKFINTKIYYVSKNDLTIWVRSRLPEEVSLSLRKYITHTFRNQIKEEI